MSRTALVKLDRVKPIASYTLDQLNYGGWQSLLIAETKINRICQLRLGHEEEKTVSIVSIGPLWDVGCCDKCG